MKREVKIGIFAVAMIGVAWAGIRFLKGFDIFSRNVEYYAAYDQINGVQNASPIMMKGVKIGSVTRLSFDPARSDKVVLQFTIKRQYHIPTDSEAKIYSNGLMGGKAIEINYGTARTYLQKGDTLRSVRERDLMDVAGSELDFFKQKVSQLTTDLSRTLENLNGLMETNADNIAGTLGNLNSVTGDMAEILSAEKNSLKSALDNLSKFSDMLGENAGRVDSIIGDVDRFTSQLTEEQFADAKPFVKENTNVTIRFFKGAPFSVEAPNFVELEVTQTDPGFKGDTATNATKPATLETGAEIRVPLFIDEGEMIRVDTRTGEYMERA